jgi:hypothetical protein
MKFCSVGAVKYKTERHGCDALQYLFDSTVAKPTDVNSFLNIVSDARSISYEAEETGNLKCAPLAGYKDNKLYLTNVTVAAFNMDTTANAAGVVNGTKPNLDAFYMFCCVYSKQLLNQVSIQNGQRSMLYEGYTQYIKCDNYSPMRYLSKTGASGYRMVLYPNKLNGKATNLPAYSDYNLGIAQGLTYYNSYSYEVLYRTYYRTTQYVTYLGNVRFSFGGASTSGINYGVANIASTLPIGANKITWSNVSVPGIQLFRPTKYYYYNDTQYSSTSYYNDAAYIVAAGNVTETSELPYLSLEGTDETVELAFSAVGYRDLEKNNIVIRDFGTDLIQTGSKDPNTLPTVQLIRALDYAPLISVYNI